MSNNKFRISMNENFTLFAILILLVITFSIMLPGQFFSLGNFQSMTFQLPELGILTLAMMITMITGGINLSIIASANLSGIIMAMIIKNLISEAPSSIETFGIVALAIAIGLAISVVIGFVNGFIISFFGVSAILATLGTSTLLEGIALVVTKGYVISGFPKGLLAIGNESIVGIPIPLIIFIIVAIVVGIVLNKSKLGLSTYMMGSNIKATKFSGINVEKSTIKVYMLSGLLSGVASIIMLARFNSAKAGYGSSYLLATVLISVLGGINPNGGFGKVSGVVLGIVLLQVISSGLNLLGMSQFLSMALWGILLLAVEGLRLIKRNKLTG